MVDFALYRRTCWLLLVSAVLLHRLHVRFVDLLKQAKNNNIKIKQNIAKNAYLHQSVHQWMRFVLQNLSFVLLRLLLLLLHRLLLLLRLPGVPRIRFAELLKCQSNYEFETVEKLICLALPDGIMNVLCVPRFCGPPAPTPPIPAACMLCWPPKTENDKD